MPNAKDMLAPVVLVTQAQEVVLTPPRVVANIPGRAVLDIRGQVVVRIQGLAAVPIQDRDAVPTHALADRVIRGLTTAKLTNGIGRHYTVNRLRLSLYFQHSSTVVHWRASSPRSATDFGMRLSVPLEYGTLLLSRKSRIV